MPALSPRPVVPRAPGPRGAPALRALALTLSLAMIGAPASAGSAPAAERSVPARLAARSLLLDVSSARGLVAAVGERGHVLLSRDQGKTWAQADVPTQSTLTGVHLHDAQRGWAVGHDGVILRTQDGGKTWDRVRWAPEEERPLLDVWFRDAEVGYAVGAYGLFLATADGGTTWEDRPVADEEWHLNHLASAASGRLYLAAEAGHAYRSDDGGETWHPLPSPYEGSFFGTLPLGEDEVVLFGLRGHAFRSGDAGETWEALPTGTEASLTVALVLGDGQALLAGLGGTVLVSRDGCRTFELRQQEDRKGISALAQTEDGTVITVGEFGVRSLPR